MRGRRRHLSRRTTRKTTRRRITPRAVLTVCTMAVLLSAGTFLAARQHFYVVDYGIKNSRLKKQIDDLEAEKRRLLLAREVAMSPAELKRTAKRLGVIASAAAEDEAVRVSTGVKNKAVPPKPDRAGETPAEVNPFVVKTAAAAPSVGDTRGRKVAEKPQIERGESRRRIVN